jgi:hypothetical protein
MLEQPSLAIDRTMLTDVVRRALASPRFEVQDWTTSTLANRGGSTPDGVLRVSGSGEDAEGTRPWEVALKRIALPSDDTPQQSLFNSRRELFAYGTELLNRLPGPVVPACCYGVSEHTGAIWLWTEVLTDVTGGQWSLAEYVFAANQLGQFNSHCVMNDLLPTEPWFARDHAQQWTGVFDFVSAWENPRIQAVFSVELRQRLTRLWAEREYFFALLNRFPQVFSHFDYKRDNLFLRTRVDGTREIAAADWGVCGVGALGGDLVSLVGASTWQFDWEPTHVAALDEAAFAAYIQGLQTTGWSGDVAAIRLAYTAWFATHFGLIIPACVGWAMDSANDRDGQRLFGRSPEERIAGWVQLCAYALDCADEAQLLMRHQNPAE